jgi:SAM-dependent methyltransferase
MAAQFQYQYQGQELDIFAHAQNWKRYWSSSITPWVSGSVLEVGAGLGTNTRLLQNPKVTRWTCLEPDHGFLSRLTAATENIVGRQVITGTTADVKGQQFDSILYIDVLEHIEDDKGEMQRSSALLKRGGHVVVLSPAHQFLFSAFDAAVGHFRRYNKKSLQLCSPSGCTLEKMFYLDLVGMLASLANRMFLKQRNPTVEQIHTWDSFIVPVSKLVDPVFGATGKTIIAVWRRA